MRDTGTTAKQVMKDSTLLRQFINIVAQEFKKWNKNDCKVMCDLVRRRAAEEALFRGSIDQHAIQRGMLVA